MAYLAPSLVKLRDEIDARWPNRDRRSDGWIGDENHSHRQSDHNPDEGGMVHAIDVDKDGINVKLLLDSTIGDRRVWYVIWNRNIWSRTYDWKRRDYNGSNPHTSHVHISINYNDYSEFNTRRWLPPPEGDDMTKDELLDALASDRGQRILARAVVDATKADVVPVPKDAFSEDYVKNNPTWTIRNALAAAIRAGYYSRKQAEQ